MYFNQNISKFLRRLYSRKENLVSTYHLQTQRRVSLTLIEFWRIKPRSTDSTFYAIVSTQRGLFDVIVPPCFCAKREKIKKESFLGK